MVIFRPSIPLSPQQQSRLELLGYPPEVVDEIKLDVNSDSPAPYLDQGYVCACINMPYCSSDSSYGYNEGLSRLSLASLIPQPALELEASLGAGLDFSGQEAELSTVPESNSLPYSKPTDLEAEGQAQSSQLSKTFVSLNDTQRQQPSTICGGLVDEGTQTPDTSEKISSQPSTGTPFTKIRRPSLRGKIWLLANRTKDSKNGGLDAFTNLWAAEQGSQAQFTPPDTPSPEKSKAILHKSPTFGSLNNSVSHHGNAEQHVQPPSQHGDSPCSAFKPRFYGREEHAKKQRCEDVEMRPISPLTLNDRLRFASSNFAEAPDDISLETPMKLDQEKCPAINSLAINNTERRPSSLVSQQDYHLHAAATLSSLVQARKLDKEKGKAIDAPVGGFIGKETYYHLQSQHNPFTDVRKSQHLGGTRELDKADEKGKEIDPPWNNNLRPPPSPTPEQTSPWNGAIQFRSFNVSVTQGSPSSPRPGFRLLSAEKPSIPVLSAETSTSSGELSEFIEGRGDVRIGPSDLPPTPRPTPRLRFKALPARDVSPVSQDKDNAHGAFDRKTSAFNQPAYFFSDSDTDSERAIESPRADKRPQDHMEFLAQTIRDHFQLPDMAPPKRAYDFPEPERTRRLLRFDREVATPYITEHRSTQSSTYEEEENEAPYLQAACGGMINLNKSGDLFDEHRFRWRNALDRMEKQVKAMTIWSYRGYGVPKSYMEHDKLAHAELMKRRDGRERMGRARKISRRAKRAGLGVDREGFVVPPRKEMPSALPGMDLRPTARDRWETDVIKQHEMVIWAEKSATARFEMGADDSHEVILPSVEETQEAEAVGSSDCKSDIDEHPELDDLRLARGLPPRKYPTRRLSPFDTMENVRLQNSSSGHWRSSAMAFSDFDLKAPVINSYPPSESAKLDDPNPKLNTIFCPTWAPRHSSCFVGKIDHSKKGSDAQMPRIVLTTPTPEPTDDDWDSEDDDGWAEEEYLQSQGAAGASFPGWDEAMVNGRLRPPHPHDPQPVGTFCPSWDPRHYDHFVKKQKEEGIRVPRVVVTMPSPEPEEEGWDSEDECEEREWDEESRENCVSDDTVP